MSVEQQISVSGYGILPADRRKQLARGVSNLFSPPLFGAAGLILAIQAQQSLQGWLWGMFYAGVAILLPVLYVIWLLWRKEITDFHIKVRQQRFRPMLFMVFCSMAAWGVMAVGGAPVLLKTIALLGALLVAVLLLITLRWKISGHATAVTAFALFGLSFWGTLALPILLLVPVVIWARLTLKRHSLAQTTAGVIVGGLFVILAQFWVVSQCGGAYLLCG